MFFDTGANASLIKNSFISKLPKSTRIDILHDINPHVVSISGHVVKSRASAKFTFNVNGFSHQLEALIVSDEYLFKGDLLLGVDDDADFFVALDNRNSLIHFVPSEKISYSMACAPVTSGSNILVPASAVEDDDQDQNVSTITTQTPPENYFDPPMYGYEGSDRCEPSIDALGGLNIFEEKDVTTQGNNTPNIHLNTNKHANSNPHFEYPSVSVASLLYPKLTHDFHFPTDHDIHHGMANSEQPTVKKGRQKQHSYMGPKKGNG